MFRNTHTYTYIIYMYVCVTIIESIEDTSLRVRSVCGKYWSEEKDVIIF